MLVGGCMAGIIRLYAYVHMKDTRDISLTLSLTRARSLSVFGVSWKEAGERGA